MSTYPGPFGLNRPQSFELSGVGDAVTIKFFNAVYAWMCVGLVVTALVAWRVAQSPVWSQAARQWWIGILILEIVLVIVISSAIQRIGAGVATALFLLYAAVNGLMLSSIFLRYASGTLASAFVISAGTFGAMSVYGMVTRRNLSGIGRFAFMALIGLVLAVVVSFFWHNTVLGIVINFAGVLIFIALTAYDTQKLRQIAQQTAGDPALAARLSIVGSLVLYLDFINLFLFILSIMGDRRR